MAGYGSVYDAGLDDPEGFWREQAGLVDWFRKPRQTLDTSQPPSYRWYVDGTLNTCYNALDRHVIMGRAQQTALIYDSPVTGVQRSYTYAQLLEEVAAFAGALRSLGVNPGDSVILYLPTIPETVVAMLACARVGAVHSIVSGGSAAVELAARIDDARPRVVLTASCGVEPSRVVDYFSLLDEALRLADHQPHAVVVKQRAELPAELEVGRDLDWATMLSAGREDPAGCVPVKATDPLYVRQVFGTAGASKTVVRDNGGHAVALAWSMATVFDVHPCQVWWAASDVGSAVGHAYVVFAPLIVGATTVLYEGVPAGAPDAGAGDGSRDAGALWRVSAEYAVEALVAPTSAIHAARAEDPDGALIRRYDLSRLRGLFLTGERLDADTHDWVTSHLDVPVVDRWWQPGGAGEIEATDPLDAILPPPNAERRSAR